MDPIPRDCSTPVRSTFSQTLRQIYLLGAYALGLTACLWLAFQVRFDFNVPPEYLARAWLIFGGMIGTKLILLFAFGQFGSLLSYFGFHDLAKLLFTCIGAALLALGVWFWGGIAYAPPRAVIVTDLLVSFLFLCGFRLSLRLVREGYFYHGARTGRWRRVAIIGAGDVGASLARDLQMRRGLGMKPVAFFDDAPQKWGTTIHGVIVEGAPEILPDFLIRQPIDEAIIAMPSASARRIREVVAVLNKLHLRFETVPSYEQMLTGKVRTSQIRPVEIQDLLGRSPINLSTDRIRDLVNEKVVLVTGAGGTIGGELCRQVAANNPRQLILVERSEFLLFTIEQELRSTGLGSTIVPVVADILDPIRMEGVFERYRPNLVFHAAAHKHVPMMEHQPAEAFRNNTIGSRWIMELSMQHGVERCVMISTDKAINPTNVMGATKRLAELYMQALQAALRAPTIDGTEGRQGNQTPEGNGPRTTDSEAEDIAPTGLADRPSPIARPPQAATKFMAVRFGNVLGSSGSVIPTFKRQIAAGGPVTVTHPDVTRYFMTVNEAVGLVLQSATQGEGGEIFVLDMGQPMKIIDLAKQLIELSGLEPEKDIEIQFTGLRPGEKLYEELNHTSENFATTDHPKIMRFISQPLPLGPLRAELDRMLAEAPSMDPQRVKSAIKTLVPEYEPYMAMS
ncbi:MAG: polysaccharide biosynthesis protein [Opitutaceae bacterium]|nr:polysaccharide biosynthesis protein [Opitutaceae bacterium]